MIEICFWPYLVALSSKISNTCKMSCRGRRYSGFLVWLLKVNLPENLGLKISMCSLMMVARLIFSGGFLVILPASILASCNKSRTSLLAWMISVSMLFFHFSLSLVTSRASILASMTARGVLSS